MTSNGCGPEWLPTVIKSLLFNWFFEASCNRHDEGYAEGGNEGRRYECDQLFWLAMRRDTLHYDGIGRAARWLMALAFFVMVRLFGWMSFNYK